ncbi:MAG: hypothetical protein AAF944_03270 [Bacteroidota bacterium]
MKPLSLSQEIMYYGGSDHRPPSAIELTAGSLKCQYEEGNLRYIQIGNIELLRMIYSAVRDRNWDTITPNISKEKVTQHHDHFTITYDCQYQRGEIDFLAHYRIRGEADGNITFSMDGKALSTFRRNRVGFCVLHPASAAGMDCQITHTDETSSEARFPTPISPHQPFQDIQRMQWSPTDEIIASLEFTGDIFETEDQRNWTDDSFKTYCTPLDLPFPVTVHQGEKIRQKVTLRLKKAPANITADSQSLQLVVSEEEIPLPPIGIGRSTEFDTLTSSEIDLLQKIHFSHYRIDLHLHEPDWTEKWKRSVAEAQALTWSLEVALHFGNQSAEQLESFLKVTSINLVSSILIFEEARKVASIDLLNQVVPKLRQHFPHAKIGSGTDYFFTELNRDRLPPKGLGSLTYSINPQVHHFDNQSLIETLQAQAYTVESAQQFANGTPVRVSPVTLKMRRNPNATGADPTPDSTVLPPSVDTRQMSLFGAGWTVGSLRNLIQSGVKSITYFETVGRKGILAGDEADDSFSLFPAKSGTVYPMYLVFRFLLTESEISMLSTDLSDPWQVEGLTFKVGKGLRAIVANLQPHTISLKLPADMFTQLKLLDETCFEAATQQPHKFLCSEYERCPNTISLSPYAIAFLKSTKDRDQPK